MPTDGSLRLRRARPEESEALAALYGAARRAAAPAMPPARHSPEEDRGWFAARLRDGEHETWVAEDDGELLGYALVAATWLDHLFVAPGRQSEGIGGSLLELVKSIRPDGFCLWVFETNVRARAFYAGHGLVELERTDGSGNEEKAPDVRMAWPGQDPVAFYRGLIDEVDGGLAELFARRVALTRVVQDVKDSTDRDAAREREIAERMARVATELGPDRLARIVHAIVTESLDVVHDR
jgi:chorismate mutase/ribosomal protein S18 acetylase RimI-like enzyme